MYLNWMNYGHLYVCESTNSGSGRQFVVAHDRLWLLYLAIIVQKLVNGCGTKSRTPIAIVIPLAIFGMRIEKFFRKKRIAVLAKTVAKRITWNVGIVLCVRELQD